MAYKKAVSKFVMCSRCGQVEMEISEEAVGGICWICCQKAVEPPAVLVREKKARERAKQPRRPRGWQFYNEFVDVEGNVFHKGKEQPDLKGTLPPTPIKKQKKKKKTFAEKQVEEQKNKEKLLKRYEKAKKAKERKAKQLGRKLK